MKYRYLILVFFIYSSVPAVGFAEANDKCVSELVYWNDYDLTVDALYLAYHQEQYKKLENALDCLMDSKKKFHSGKPGPAAVYWFYRKELSGHTLNKENEVRITKWKASYPDSKYAAFASIRLLYAHAWKARGIKFANKTGQDRFTIFKEKLLETEALLLSEKNTLRDTPVSQNLLLSVVLDGGGGKGNAVAVFNFGIEKWPDYYDFYEIMLSRVVPKWGGSWEIVDGAIKQWTSLRLKTEGKSLYSRLYYSLHKRKFAEDARETLASWPLMKESLKSLVVRYPTEKHKAIAASYACYYYDKEYYYESLSSLKVRNEHYSEAWVGSTTKKLCDQYFKSLPAAEGISFEQAKTISDKTESELDSKTSTLLVNAQAKLGGTAFQVCMKLTHEPPAAFTVVVNMNGDGIVQQSWLKGQTRFAQCFHSIMVENFRFKPPFSPFYTSFEYENK